MPTDLIIIGAGGSSREIADCARQSTPAQWNVLGFLDDNHALEGQAVDGLPVLGGIDAAARFPGARFVLGIADYNNPALRRTLVARLDLPAERFAAVVDSRAAVSPHATIGPGSVVLAGTVISPGVRVGSHVIVSQAVVLAHDAVIGDYTVIAPGVVVCGNVTVGHSAYLGAAAILAPRIHVGEEALVGMSTSVMRPVEAGSTIMGNPARVIRSRASGTQRWRPQASSPPEA